MQVGAMHSKLSEEYIKTTAKFYGRDPAKKITPLYKENINEAATQIALQDPNLLLSRQKLLDLARTEGYTWVRVARTYPKLLPLQSDQKPAKL